MNPEPAGEKAIRFGRNSLAPMRQGGTMKLKPLPLAVLLSCQAAFAQATQISVTNAAAAAVLRGTYNPAAYQAATVIDNISVIAPDMAARVSRDSLQSYLTRLTSFQNRNSGSDTVSTT